MSSNIKSITKQINDSMKDIFGSSEILMEEVSIATVIRNELFLANKDWIRGYKSFFKEPEDKGGLFKILNDLKGMVTSKQIVNPREQFLSFGKQYRKFLQQCLYVVDKEIDFEKVSTEDFKEILKIFPEIIICLTKEMVEKNKWQEIIMGQIKEEFETYANAIYDNSFGKNIKVQRITRLGNISIYSNAKKNYWPIRNYLVLQNALLTNLEILDIKAQENPFLYINAFTRQEEYSLLNKEYVVGVRKNINKKIFNILNLNNNSVFFGFIHLRLIKDNLPFLMTIYESGVYKNLFQVFMKHIYEHNNDDELNLSFIHEVSQYMNIDSEDCEWEKVSPNALENILFLLKQNAVVSTVDSLDIHNDKHLNLSMSFYAKIINLALTESTELYASKRLDKKIIEFIIKNFKYLTKEQKEKEYQWLLDHSNEKEQFDVVLMSLVRDNALMNDNDENTNEIEILFNFYLKDIKKYQHRFDINYALWLNRYQENIWLIADKISEDINIINTIPNNSIIGNNKNKFISLNLKKLNQKLININTQEEQNKFFFFIEKENQKLLGTSHIRSLIDGYRLCNKEFKETLDLIDVNVENNLYRKILLDRELASLMIKERDFEVNDILNDIYLLNTNILFKGIKLKSSLNDNQEKQINKISDLLKIYDFGSTSFKINHFLYAMTYQYIGKAAFLFEEDLNNFINQQRDKKSFENIASNEILFFIKDWIYRASREGYLVSKLEEMEEEKKLMEVNNEIVLREEKNKDKVKVRKKI